MDAEKGSHGAPSSIYMVKDQQETELKSILWKEVGGLDTRHNLKSPCNPTKLKMTESSILEYDNEKNVMLCLTVGYDRWSSLIKKI